MRSFSFRLWPFLLLLLAAYGADFCYVSVARSQSTEETSSTRLSVNQDIGDGPGALDKALPNLAAFDRAADEQSAAEANSGESSGEPSLEGEPAATSLTDIAATPQDIWTKALDLDSEENELEALYAKVDPSVTSHLFQLDRYLTSQLSSLVATDFGWGDYDNDGDLDLLISGIENSVEFTRIYRNDRGALALTNADLIGITRGEVAWGDYDLDGDLDILLSGKTANKQLVTRVYQNHQGQFIDINADITGLLDSRIAWGDFDSDADLDILISGEDANFYQHTLLYQNHQGHFIRSKEVELPSCKCDVSWADYNQDNQLDALLVGTGPYELIADMLQNTKEGFSNIEANVMPVNALGDAEWADYDSDGDLDILITGKGKDKLPTTSIYRNDGNRFTETTFPLHPVWDSDASWGDYDNDGDLDLLLTGNLGENAPLTRLYRNDRTTFAEVNLGLPSLHNARVAWGDYDNDLDLDILFSGWMVDGQPTTQLWINGASPNMPPGPPTNPTASVVAEDVILQWLPGADVETPVSGLRYSLAIQKLDGETMGASEVSAEKLSRYSYALGDTGLARRGLSATLALPLGIYGWAVQTIDSAAERSEWTPVQYLELSADVSVSHSVAPSIVKPGDAITITLEFSNTGNYLASNVTLTSSIPSEISMSESFLKLDEGIRISQTKKAATPLVSWDAKPAQDSVPANTMVQWRVSDLEAGQNGRISVIGMVAETASARSYTSTLLISADADFLTENNLSYGSIDVRIPPRYSWVNAVFSFFAYRKIAASIGFGMICVLLVAAVFVR